MNSNTNAVSVLPPTSGIQDSATRSFLDALTNMLDARSGYTNKDAPERFITAAEFQGLTNRALYQAFAQGGMAPGSGGDKDIPSAEEINDSIDNLSDFIRKTLVYQILGEEIGLIDISELRHRVSELGSGIFREEKVRETADEALAGSISSVQVQLGQVQAGVSQEILTRATKDLALASAINTVWAAIGGSQAVIQDGALAAATPNSSQATKWNQVVASVTDPNTGLVNSTSIKQELNSYASNADGKFNSIYSVRAQVSVGGQTVVGGFGLSATAGAGSAQGPTINFGVRADTFFIAATSATPDAATQIGQGSSIPFMVLTSNQVVNGVTYGPGVYLKKAVIGAATIGTAQIADLAATTAKIDNLAVTNGKIANLQVDTLKIAGNAVTVTNLAQGGSNSLPGGGETILCDVYVDMGSLGSTGSSGVVLQGYAAVVPGSDASASMIITRLRDGAVLGDTPNSLRGGFYTGLTVFGWDPAPNVGSNGYRLRIWSPTSGPGSNVGATIASSALVASGGKR